MRPVLVALAGTSVIALAVLIGSAGAMNTALFVVPCADTIGNLSNPAGSDRQVALGLLSLPSRQVGSEPLLRVLHWRRWTKVDVGVRRNPSTVTISVPNAWRSKVEIGWGNRTVIVPSIRFSSCADGTSPSWSIYAGGLYLAQHIVCVPLIVSNGHRATTVRIAIAGNCP